MRICCIYTGGTIGCQPGPEGLAPALDDVAERLHALLEPRELLSFRSLPRLLDSSCMQPSDWQVIAREVAQALQDHDGVLLLHGTDTMAYTAAALSFMLDGLAQPVLLTGAQRPWFMPGSDAPANVQLALQALRQPQAGVWLAFGGELLHGRYVHKWDADADRAFIAPNAPAHARAPASVAARPVSCRPLADDASVLALKLYPGCSAAWLGQGLLARPPDALVLECYGSGNLPDDPDLLAALLRLAGQGVPIVVASQCPAGTVRLGVYQAGSVLARIGAIPAGRLGSAACVAQLHVLLAECANTDELRSRWQNA
ncbi:asparaginase [Chitinilyticum piscinae]|uniref:Asparaginase n=1 Tax=Chitinilyticum piscinae TaxID=2866724 RepID=A0A8J7FLZ1_9NEIS|nr:asparaginase [Chitinilyticum piscinae]MBE9610347.1 asparaginase [Chitinilyticum piscinae]